MDVSEGGLHGHDTLVEGACPTCGGVVKARFTRSAVWAWCAPCRRLTHPRLVAGPSGPVLMHLVAAA
jgi:hypothetical protein